MTNNKYYQYDEDEEEDSQYFGQFRPLRTKGLNSKEERDQYSSHYWDED